uniref:Fibronectin type-III domain-containing protein n=1 Tax=Anopheles farauti TaxID=69004 RepID=A0A182Q665_9DIPT
MTLLMMLLLPWRTGVTFQSPEIPDTPRNCELHNDTVLEVVCLAGSDGGLMQSFLLEVVGGAVPSAAYNLDFTRGPPTEIDNEISTMNDQATLAPLFRIQEQIPQFKLHSLEPGRDYQLLVYAVNAKGKSDPPFIIDKVRVGSALVPPYVDETIISEDPTPAETSHQDKQKQQSQMVMFAAVAAAVGVIIASIIVAGFVAICRLKRQKPPEPQEVRKRMRPARTDVPSMYAEDDVFDDEYQRQLDVRCSRASSTIRSSRYVSEGFVQYSQPSLNGRGAFSMGLKISPVMIPILYCRVEVTSSSRPYQELSTRCSRRRWARWASAAQCQRWTVQHQYGSSLIM